MDPQLDLQEPDEARPAKRARLEARLQVTEDEHEEVVDDDDWDDVYDNATLPDPVDAQAEPAPNGDVLLMSSTENVKAHREEKEGLSDVDGGVPVEAIDDGNELVLQEKHPASTDEPSARMLEETSTVDVGQPHKHDVPEPPNEELETRDREEHVNGDVQEPVSQAAAGSEQPAREDDSASVTTDYPAPEPVPEYPDFLAAAAAQKENQEAEWQFDSSDDESSSSDSTPPAPDEDDEEESGSEGGYEMLDPATAAKILMAGDGNDEDGEEGKGKTGDHQPRTANEVKDAVIPKPDVVVTKDMKITFLGTVERTVENMVLIKAETPGEYQVLESGSVLCTENREVLGAVAETLGRVQEPLYSVAFTNAQEIEEAGMHEYGKKVFYVDSHSSFVFTQPLKGMKGTDASNIHDEEVGEDELEFSDDEVEAAYKRQRKAAKRGGRGGLSRSAFNEGRGEASSFGAPGHDSGFTFVGNESDVPKQSYGGGMSYDEGDVQEEFYVPLKRPDNLSQLMAGGGMPPPRPPHGQFDRGRGRGRGHDRGRGRGDRGRGRGGFDQRRGGRGGLGQDRGGRGGLDQPNGHRGSAHTFPDRHNDSRMNDRPRQSTYSSSPPQRQQRQYPVQQEQYQPQQAYQFNGYTFQYGSPQAPPQQQQQPAPQPNYYNQQQSPTTPSMPAGAYVNPAFFQNQQWAQQPQQPQQQQMYNPVGWQGQQQQQYAQPGAAPQSQSNLADLLRQLGGQHGQQ